MKTQMVLIAALGLAAVPAFAKKDCEKLKAEIEFNIIAKKVPAYTLKIVPNGEEGDYKVVGTCDGGTKKIIYKRGAGDAPKKS